MDRIRVWPEDTAKGELKDIYKDICKEMRYAHVPTPFQAFALYPEFMRLFWKEVRPLVRHRAIEHGAAQVLRRAGERVAAELRPESDIEYLRGRKQQRNLSALHQGILPFYLGAPRIFVLMSRIYGWFFENVPGETYESVNLQPLPYPRDMGMEVKPILDSQASPAERELFERIRLDMKVPVTNVAYRALARNPEFLKPAWASVRRVVGTPEYKSIEQELFEVAGAWSRELPSTSVTREKIESLPDMDDYSIRMLSIVAETFYRMFPGLIINLTYWSHQLHAVRATDEAAASGDK